MSETGGGERRIAALDGLRGVAILWVVMHHSMSLPRDPLSPASAVFNNLAMAGWIGVDLFFVLSGFLITGILLRTLGQPGWLRNFLARRALRVLPLYFIVIFFCFNVITRLPLESLDWLRELAPDQWWYWLHLANFRRIASVLDPERPTVGWFSTWWSLSIEEQFYVFWPLILWLAGRQRLGWVCGGGILAVNLLRVAGVWSGQEGPVAYYFTFTRIDGLMLGAWLAWMNEVPGRLGGYRNLARSALALSLLAFLVPIAMGEVGGGRETPYGRIVLYAASVFGSGAVVWKIIVDGPTSRLSRLLVAPVLLWFGQYSYAIYVFNKPIVAGISEGLRVQAGPLGTVTAWLGYGLISLCCLLAGWLSWHLVEKHFLGWKRFFESRQVPAAPAMTGESPGR